MKYQFNERKYDAYTLLNYTVSVANKQVVTIIIFCWLVFLVTSSLEELGYIITLYIGKYWLVQGTYSSIILQSNKLKVRVFSFTFMSNKFPREITTTSVTIWCVTNCSSLALFVYQKKLLYPRPRLYIYPNTRVPFHWFNFYSYLTLGVSASCQLSAEETQCTFERLTLAC